MQKSFFRISFFFQKLYHSRVSKSQILHKFTNLNNQDISQQKIAMAFFLKTLSFRKYSHYLVMNAKYKFERK